jgi:hypothetical protein
MAEPEPGDGPYVGPRPFDREERTRFFGREQRPARSPRSWWRTASSSSTPPRGAGKTSLLNAGGAARLARGTEDGFEVLPPVPVCAGVWRPRRAGAEPVRGEPDIANLALRSRTPSGDRLDDRQGSARPPGPAPAWPTNCPRRGRSSSTSFRGALHALSRALGFSAARSSSRSATRFEQDPLLRRRARGCARDFIAQARRYAALAPPDPDGAPGCGSSRCGAGGARSA